MTNRFGRDYELVIGIGEEAIIIRPPIRIVFSADKSLRGAINTLKLEIYNLREDRRLKIVKDAEQVKYIPLQLKVGYQGNLELIFRGSVYTAKNAPQLPEILTVIECKDGGHDFINAFTSKTIAGGSDYIPTLIEDMPNTSPGKIAPGEPLVRPKVLVGNTMDLVRSGLKPGEVAFIDNEELNVIRTDSQIIDNVVPTVSAATGLLNTPDREKQKVTFQTMMNPEVKLGRMAKLISKFAPHLNGLYRTETINYYGDTDGDAWGQTCTGYLIKTGEVI